MIGRLAFFALLGVIAVFTSIAQLDQQSEGSPAHAAVVPAAFSANASRYRARAAMLVDRPDIALVEARNHVRLRPVPAESLTVFALTSIATGDEAEGLAALEAATKRGWREPVAQLASGESALQQGEYAIAAQRAVALLSTGNMREPTFDLIARIVAAPEGQEAMADRFAAFGRWQNNSLMPGSAAAAPSDWAATLGLAAERGAELSCDRLEQIAGIYREDGEAGAAAAISLDNCAR